jgi:hypothetical protein
MKIVVFDLDETLGYFTQINIFWEILKDYYKITNNKILLQEDFNMVLDLYPECLRPNIMNILDYLRCKKDSKCCGSLMIYTNNTGAKEWTKMITEYFDSKLKCKLFDQIIGAFKIKGKKLEICRTSHKKKYDDLVRCTKIPSNAEICYLDDTYYPHMDTKQVYYINVEPYFHDLDFDIIINRYLLSEQCNMIRNKEYFKSFMKKNIELYKYAVLEKNNEEYDIEHVIGKQMLHLLETFFNKSKKNTTRKNRGQHRNKTSKITDYV